MFKPLKLMNPTNLVKALVLMPFIVLGAVAVGFVFLLTGKLPERKGGRR